MKKRNLSLKTFPEIIILLLLFFYLISCSKGDQNNDNTRVIQINLTDTTYHVLLHDGGTFIIPAYNIIIGYKTLVYFCADVQCPICGRKIKFAGPSNFNPCWYCDYCGVKYNNGKGYWNQDGNSQLPGSELLRVYTIDRSGNILNIHLHL